jgi:hypothetical protein
MSKKEKVKKPFYKKVWFWIIVVVIVVIGAVNSGGSKNKTASNNPSTKTSVSKAPTSTPVTFKDMVAAYTANGVNADDQFKGKMLEFTGTVKTITAGVLGGSDVTIDAGAFVADNDMETTSATVNVSSDTAKKLTAGQSYTFIAKGAGATVSDGWVMTLNFTDGTVK